MLKSPKIYSLLLLLFIFIVLAVIVGLYPINTFDLAISRFIQQFRTPALDQLMIAVSDAGRTPIALCFVLITTLLFYVFKYKREAIAILGISFSGLITFVLKRVFNRPRPTDTEVTLIDIYQNHSFPSGHTLSYVVFFGFLILLMRYLKSIPNYIRQAVNVLCYFMLISGPISRIYLGAHWFTDILGGIIVGVIYLQCLNYYYKKASKKKWR